VIALELKLKKMMYLGNDFFLQQVRERENEREREMEEKVK